MFYMGKEFDTKTNKEYRTIKGAKEAAEKAGLNVFDEVGQLVASYVVKLTDDVPEGALEENVDGSMNTYNEAGEKVGTATQAEAKAAMDRITKEEVQKAAQEPPKEEGAENLPPDSVEAVNGKIQRVFEGKLRIRRAPSDDPAETCGVSLFDKKRVTEKHTVAGKVWYKTLDGYYISGDPKHTMFIPDQE